MEKIKKWSPILLFALLTIVYFRYTIFAGPDAFLTRHLATDLYEPLMNASDHLEWLKQGFVGLGDFWVNRGGGFPAVPLEQLIAPYNLLLMAVYIITDSPIIALRIIVPLTYFATLITAYWYGTTLFKRRDASIILAIAYTFSMYGVLHLEHLSLLIAQPLMLITLVFLEKLLSSPDRPKYIILLSLALFSLYLSQLYPFYFTIVFIGLRVALQCLQNQQIVRTLKSITKVGVLLLLVTIPFLVPQLLNIPSQQIQAELNTNLTTLSQPPSAFFLRGSVDVPVPEVGTPQFLGLVLVVLALIPIILRKTNSMYIFYLFILLLSMTYTLGVHSPLNVAGWIQANVPLTFFLRAVGRSMVIGYLGLAVCAAIGYTFIADRLRSYASKLLLLSIVIILIFCDLTVGYEPSTTPEILIQNEAYEFLRDQPEDFRVVEVPSLYLQMATSSTYTGHDVLSGYAWGHGYFSPQHTFISVYYKHTQRLITAQEAALYGIKYIILNMDPQYYKDLHLALKYYSNPNKLEEIVKIADYLDSLENYKLVYNKGGYSIYENILYRGIVFSDEAIIQYERTDSNTIVIDTQSALPATVYISQSYNKGWIATLEDGSLLKVKEVDSIQQLDVPAGNHLITLHYQRYESFFLNYVAFYLTALMLILALALHKRRRYLLPVVFIYGNGLILLSLIAYPYEVILYQSTLTCLGIALVISSTLYYILNRRRLT